MTHPTLTAEFDATLTRLAARPAVVALVDALVRDDEATLEAQIALTEIAAPPFGEHARGERMAEFLTAAGLADVDIDGTGNVSAWLTGTSDAPPLLVTAHLDTVFPAGTDVAVSRDGPLLRAPGISDDGRGLAALVALARVLGAARVRTRHAIRFVATVGEEGAGDLRGVKGLFSSAPRSVASAFISLDGAGLERIVSRALGSRRFRISISGPGGHSWVDWGTANPAHALMALGSRLTDLTLADNPKTTLTVARLGGGKSINAIPQESWLEIDCRSASAALLEELVGGVYGEVHDEAARHPELRYEVEVIGDRPPGATDDDHALVQWAMAATRFMGATPTLARSSTDANVPMSLGIPAITLGCGGEAGKAHTTDEWYRNTRGPDGIVRALYVMLLIVGLMES